MLAISPIYNLAVVVASFKIFGSSDCDTIATYLPTRIARQPDASFSILRQDLKPQELNLSASNKATISVEGAMQKVLYVSRNPSQTPDRGSTI